MQFKSDEKGTLVTQKALTDDMRGSKTKGRRKPLRNAFQILVFCGLGSAAQLSFADTCTLLASVPNPEGAVLSVCTFAQIHGHR
jgi:hypothetical protein